MKALLYLKDGRHMRLRPGGREWAAVDQHEHGAWLDCNDCLQQRKLCCWETNAVHAILTLTLYALLLSGVVARRQPEEDHGNLRLSCSGDSRWYQRGVAAGKLAEAVAYAGVGVGHVVARHAWVVADARPCCCCCCCCPGVGVVEQGTRCKQWGVFEDLRVPAEVVAQE